MSSYVTGAPPAGGVGHLLPPGAGVDELFQVPATLKTKAKTKSWGASPGSFHWKDKGKDEDKDKDKDKDK